MIADDMTAIVTGASGRIGLGLTKALLERGYRVVANSRRISTSGTLTASDRLLLPDGDIGRSETGARLVDTAVRNFGSVGLLVNNAGIFIPKPFTEYTAEDFEKLVSTNLKGFFHATQPAMARMQRQQSGHIVTISTTLVDQPLAVVPGRDSDSHQRRAERGNPRVSDRVRPSEHSGERHRGGHYRHADAQAGNARLPQDNCIPFKG